LQAARDLGLRIKRKQRALTQLDLRTLPCLALRITASDQRASLDLITDATPDKIVYFPAGDNNCITQSCEDYAAEYSGIVFLAVAIPRAPQDPDAAASDKAFGFRWFIPELLKHRRVWRDVLIGSLILQLLALATPLFTQAIIDKVVVHRTTSTLLVIGIGLAVFMLFTSLLGWARQILLLHTGNRVDAVLAMTVFKHLFSLPTQYFETRPTGVIAARLQAVETIREFIAGTAVSLLLDIPFLLIFIAIMLWYSVMLTLIALAVLAVIVVLSLALAPLFQSQLNQQFLLGARNQAFMTEYIAGIETVKSLQMEAQLQARFSTYLGDYLNASFKTRQLANLYNTIASTLEQLMKLLILIVGAYIAMQSTEFTIGMLIAFQMFAGNLSSPMMRLVGLWQQFQQARLSVTRLGDVMNAPPEPYSVLPVRAGLRVGHIEIEGLAFRYSEKHPWLYRDFNFSMPPGSRIALMGPSGCGKSTFAKLLQGFYPVEGGRIRIDGTDIQSMSANALRSYFGVVPQETVLFSGTVYDNLLAADPHVTFEQIMLACMQAEIHDTIEALPDGYQTVIGERGTGLSGGQRQRIAIARALLKQPPILIFDEATSSLDPETAQQFAHTINQLQGQVSMLFITHALPADLHIDSVMHLQSGSQAAMSRQRNQDESQTI
jgi:subfamily B ATP-binding cassette protein HlyB/CyaB